MYDNPVVKVAWTARLERISTGSSIVIQVMAGNSHEAFELAEVMFPGWKCLYVG